MHSNYYAYRRSVDVKVKTVLPVIPPARVGTPGPPYSLTTGPADTVCYQHVIPRYRLLWKLAEFVTSG